jgi:hypothetical protein
MGNALGSALHTIWYPFELITATLGLTSSYQRAAVGMAIGYLITVVFKPSFAYTSDGTPKSWRLMSAVPEDEDDIESYESNTTSFPWFFVPITIGLAYGTLI